MILTRPNQIHVKTKVYFFLQIRMIFPLKKFPPHAYRKAEGAMHLKNYRDQHD